MSCKYTNKVFIVKSNEKHVGKYNYSKAEYVSANKKVCIICPEHGEFWQTPGSHIHGSGCIKCSNIKKKTKYNKTNSDFMCEANEKHMNKYDYSKVEYVSANKKVCIICPEHGEFWQTPKQHLNGSGCLKCGRITVKHKLTSNGENFISKAKTIHGYKYNYSKVEYIKANEKVCIICPEHGEFWQTPNTHLNGSGCSKCGNKLASTKISLTHEEFIKRSNEKHEFKYDYSKSKFINTTVKIEIKCKKCGYVFNQSPSCHMNGQGCPKCVGKFKYNTNSFIEELKKKHVDSIKYDFSKLTYINNKKKLCITCLKHGDFYKTPNSLINGNLCPKCGKERGANKIRLDTESFILKSKNKHGDKYNYINSKYVNAKSKIIITCSDHGDFLQTPGSHIYGSGCPICRESKLEKKMGLFLDENNIKYIRGYRPTFLKSSKGQQSLDFYLPEYNIAIECQGSQHFKESSFFKNFNDVVNRDVRKFKLCLENDMKLMYFTTQNIKCIKEKNHNNGYYDNIYIHNLFTNLNKIKKEILC